ncbi:MAG: PepSY domain-containing protein [Halioglobus sp.]|nr:PepSY domain-containing protein [Halioglobus sp.]MBP6724734.1 PepSY domain-containing protein [Halioglobus sp.]
MRRRLVGYLWRWHRRLGLVAAVFALLLAVSGIALNHTPELGLDRRFVDWPWLNRAYGDLSSAPPAFQLGEQWLSRSADGRVYLDTREVAPCNGELVGALAAEGLVYAACARELLLITATGELVESITGSTGLPSPLTGIGLAGGEVAVQAAGNWWLADLELADFSARAPAGEVISQSASGHLPAQVREGIPAPAAWLSWERLLLDVHSGRVLGRLGVLWVDLVGVLVSSLALSGIAMWWLRRRRRAGS